MRKAQIIDKDIDFVTCQKSFSGKITKQRYKILDRYCRRNSYRSGNCGHEHDCCGCVSSVNTSFSYKHNQVTITQTIHFNY